MDVQEDHLGKPTTRFYIGEGLDMARINIEEKWWSDARRTKLIRMFKGDARLADGLMIQAWRIAQEHGDKNFLIPFPEYFCLEDGDFLFDCGLAEVRLSELEEVKNIQANSKQCLEELKQGLERAKRYLVYVKGSENYLGWVNKLRANGSMGGKKSAQRPRDNRGRLLPKTQANSKPRLDNSPSQSKPIQPSDSGSDSDSDSGSIKKGVIKNFADGESPPPQGSTEFNRTVWEKYSCLIEDKFKTKPVRNAKVNTQIATLTKRIPHQDVMDLLEFYFKSENSYYSKNMFDIGLLVADSHKLHLQMKSGINVTSIKGNGYHPMTKEQLIQKNNDEVFAQAFAKAKGEAHGSMGD